MNEKEILVVANHEKNLELLAGFLDKQGYQATTASSITELDQVLNQGNGVDMALIDVSGFDHSIWDRCEKIRNEGLPFFIISPRKSKRAKEKSLSEGARDVLTKPLEKERLLKLVKVMLGE